MTLSLSSSLHDDGLCGEVFEVLSTGISFLKGLEWHKTRSVHGFLMIDHGMADSHRGSVLGTLVHGDHGRAFGIGTRSLIVFVKCRTSLVP